MKSGAAPPLDDDEDEDEGGDGDAATEVDVVRGRPRNDRRGIFIHRTNRRIHYTMSAKT